MNQCIKFMLFWNDTLRVSDGLSVHHQEFSLTHACCCMNSLELLMIDGKTVRTRASFQNKINLIHECIYLELI